MSTIERFIDVHVPLRTAYNQWTQFESFPMFMDGVREVRQLDATRLHWRAMIGGVEKEWDAEITEQTPDRRVSWRSIDGAPNDGIVTFEAIDDNTTRVHLNLSYEPQNFVEKAGDALGFVTWKVENDLRRFREFIESRGQETGAWRGEIHDAEVEGDLPAARAVGAASEVVDETPIQQRASSASSVSSSAGSVKTPGDVAEIAGGSRTQVRSYAADESAGHAGESSSLTRSNPVAETTPGAQTSMLSESQTQGSRVRSYAVDEDTSAAGATTTSGALTGDTMGGATSGSAGGMAGTRPQATTSGSAGMAGGMQSAGAGSGPAPRSENSFEGTRDPFGSSAQRDEQRSVADQDRGEEVVTYPGITGPGAEPNADPSWDTPNDLLGSSDTLDGRFESASDRLRSMVQENEELIARPRGGQSLPTTDTEGARSSSGLTGLGGQGMGGTAMVGGMAEQAGPDAMGGAGALTGSGQSGARGTQAGGEGTGSQGGGTGNMGGGLGSDIGTGGARGGMGGAGNDIANAGRASHSADVGAGVGGDQSSLAGGTGGGVAANMGRGDDVGGGAVSGYADEDTVRGGMSGGTTGGIRESEATGMSGGMRSGMGVDASGGMGTTLSGPDAPQTQGDERGGGSSTQSPRFPEGEPAFDRNGDPEAGGGQAKAPGTGTGRGSRGGKKKRK